MEYEDHENIDVGIIYYHMVVRVDVASATVTVSAGVEARHVRQEARVRVVLSHLCRIELASGNQNRILRLDGTGVPGVFWCE